VHDRPFDLDCLFRIYHVDLANSAAPKLSGPAVRIIPDLPAIAARKRAFRAVRTRTVFARTRFVNI
jgi:hypothetical protein